MPAAMLAVGAANKSMGYSTCRCGPWKPRAAMATAMLSQRAIRFVKSRLPIPTQMVRVPRSPC